VQCRDRDGQRLLARQAALWLFQECGRHAGRAVRGALFACYPRAMYHGYGGSDPRPRRKTSSRRRVSGECSCCVCDSFVVDERRAQGSLSAKKTEFLLGTYEQEEEKVEEKQSQKTVRHVLFLHIDSAAVKNIPAKFGVANSFAVIKVRSSDVVIGAAQLRVWHCLIITESALGSDPRNVI